MVLKRPEVLEVIIVDDGSSDRSVKEAQKIKDRRLKIERHKTNQGKGAAVRTGIKQALGEFLIIQDADLEYFPSDFPILLKPLLKRQAFFVIGNRWQSKRGYFIAQAGNWYMNKLTNLLFKTNYGDSYSCYKIGSTKLWRRLKLKSSGFEIESEIAAKLALNNIKVTEVAISYNPRSFSEGKKINFKDIVFGTRKLLSLKP